jgi:acetolactate synthase-1/3 small subunit
VLGLVESAGATVLDEAGEHITVSLVDDPGRVDAFEELLAPHGILTVQRTGRVALPALEG